MFKLIRRISGISSYGIYGIPGLHIPNFLEKVTNVVEDHHHLETNIKLTRMDNMHCLRSWTQLVLLNQEPIEDEEVVTMNAILATVEASPGSSPYIIKLPKVSS